MHKLRVVVLISGNGTNLQAIIDSCQQNSINAAVVAVISNNPQAFGLERAKQARIATAIINPKEFPALLDHDKTLINTIDSFNPGLIVLAGYMRILSTVIVKHYQGRLINIHPSLLPKYQGLHTYERALAAGEKEHGTSVHFVTDILDGGPVIAQERVTILPDDTPESLALRTVTKEHQLYPKVIGWFAAGRLKLQDNQVYLDGQPCTLK